MAISWGWLDEDNTYENVGAYMVALDDGRVLPLCSGTLVHPQVFMTAAHCTAYADELAAAGMVTAVDVSFDVDVRMEANPTLLPVAETHTHPDYDDFAAASNPHDVGVLILAEPVTGIDRPRRRRPRGHAKKSGESHQSHGPGLRRRLWRCAGLAAPRDHVRRSAPLCLFGIHRAGAGPTAHGPEPAP